ncbi:hypothetical protein ACLOJK_038921 [Asimina triloba]
MSFQDLEQKSRASSHRRPRPSGNASVAAGIFQLNTAVSGFRRLVDSIGTVKDTPELRHKLHDTRLRIGELVKETSAQLRALSDTDRNSDVNPSKKIEDAKLARDFQAILQEYQKVQQLSAERESTYAPSVPPSSLPISSGSNNQVKSDADLESQRLLGEQRRSYLALIINGCDSVHQGFTLETKDNGWQEVLWLGNEVAFNEAIIEEREQGVKEIQDQIVEANEIFRDLAVLVHEQGLVIDDIDSNIGGTYAASTQANTQLAKASKNVKSRSSWVKAAGLLFVQLDSCLLPKGDEFQILSL